MCDGRKCAIVKISEFWYNPALSALTHGHLGLKSPLIARPFAFPSSCTARRGSDRLLRGRPISDVIREALQQWVNQDLPGSSGRADSSLTGEM